MQITFIRHLPTEWNIRTWLQGRMDIEILPISEDIQKKIEDNQAVLEGLPPFQTILASTLKRTHQSAKSYGLTATTEPLLDELDFGPFEGRPKSDLIDEVGELWLGSPRDLILGESLVAFENRIFQFLEKYKESDPILVFGHGSWIRAFLSITQVGHINRMNRILVENNECISLNINNL